MSGNALFVSDDWALSGGGECHDRFGVVVGGMVVESRIEGRFRPAGRVPEWQADEEVQTEGDAVEVIDVSAYRAASHPRSGAS